MKTSIWKRCWSLLLAVVMVFEMMPYQAFALTEDTHNHDVAIEDVVDQSSDDTLAPMLPADSDEADVSNKDTDDKSEPGETDGAVTPENTGAPAQPDEDKADDPQDKGEEAPPENTPSPTPDTEVTPESTPEEIPAPTPTVEPTPVQPEETPVPEKEEKPYSDAYYELEKAMENILVKYLGVTDMDKDTMGDTMTARGEAKAKEAQAEVDRLFNSTAAKQITETEAQVLAENNPVFFDFVDILENMFAEGEMIAEDITVKGLTISAQDANALHSPSETSFKVDVSASQGRTKSVDVVISNNTNKPLKVTMSISGQAGSLGLSSPTLSMTDIDKQFNPKDSITVKITAKGGRLFTNNTTTTFSNIVVTELAGSSNVTVNYDNTKGSVTVNGTAATSGNPVSVSQADGMILSATAKSGYSFAGWVTEDNKLLSFDKNYSASITEDTTVKALFNKENSAVFGAGTSTSKDSLTVFADLNEVIEYCEENSSTYIVLLKSGTLYSGEYNIPENVNLLIPYDDSHTYDFDDKPEATETRENPYLFRQLTMDSGAIINCKGKINVNAKQYTVSTNKTGLVNGRYGAIYMNDGSVINMESGSNMYAYGYIAGEGLIEAKSGSNIYQLFQVMDWRGGSNSAELQDSLKGNAFLISQFYIQNIESYLKINSGSTMYGVAGISAKLVGIQQTTTAVVGTNKGMFHINDGGYAILKYNKATDRMNLDFYGSLTTSNISLGINAGWGADLKMETKDFILGIPMNYTVNVLEGSTLKFEQNFRLLPGCEINIHKGAQAFVDAGGVYIYDKDDWNAGKYTYTSNIYPLEYVYGGKPVARSVNSDAILRIDGTLTASAPIYTTNNVSAGGNAGLTGSGTFYNNVTNLSDTSFKEVQGSSTTLVDITCVPVVGNLNGYDGQTSFGTGEYKSINGKWYQYTAKGEGVTFDSNIGDSNTGVTVSGETAYVTNSKDNTATLIATVDDDYCKLNVTATGGTVTLDETTGEYKVTDITGDITVTAGSCIAGEEIADRSEGATTPATCENPGTYQVYTVCTKCGTELSRKSVNDPENPATGHTEKAVSAKAESCTEPGHSEYTVCSVCEKELTTPTIYDATDHNYNDGVVTKQPTCIEEGVKTYTCINTNCLPNGEKDSYTEEIGMSNHSFSGENSKEEKKPTCDEDGYSYHFICDVCGAPDPNSYNKLDALNHKNAIIVDAKAPTCEEAGWPEYFKCPDCGKFKTADGEWTTTKPEIKATGHTPVVDEAKAPTCTETGLTEGSHCEVCEKVLTAQQVVQKTGHTLGEAIKDASTVVDAKCTTDGSYETYRYCTNKNCDYREFVEKVTVNKLGHDYTVFVGKTKEPTCVDKGVAVYKCSRCEAIENRDIEATGEHTPVEIPEVAPTCTTAGSTVGEKCSICNKVLKAPETIGVLGHQEVIDKAVAPTCTTTGLTEGKHCERCGETLTAQQVVSALGHTEERIPSKPATCTEPGLTAGRKCSVCGTITKEQTVIAVIPHTLGEAIKDESTVVKETCTTDGSYETYKYCKKCEYKEFVEKITINKLGHEFKVFVETIEEPTCVDKGIAKYKCSRCDATEERQDIPATGIHKEEDIPGKPATCTETGLTAGKKCTVCDLITVEQVVIPLESHNYDFVVTLPTCTTDGYTTYTCHCGHTYTDNKVEKLGHDYSMVLEDTYIAPKCTVDGKEADKKCVRCDEKIIGDSIKAIGHKYTETVDNSAKAPTCTEDGKEADKKCVNCDDIQVGATITKTGHDEVIDPEVKPKCTETGLTEGVHCGTCKEVLTPQEIVDALGHDYVSVVTEPTCTDQGYTTHSCSRCDSSYIDSYTDKIGENHIFDENAEPITVYATCTVDGYKAKVCTECGFKEKIEGTDIKSLGHFYEYSVLTETCTEGGYTTRTCQDCDYSDTVDFVNPLGHDCVATKTYPTCTEQGYTTHKCSRCEYTHIPADSYVPAYGHQFDYALKAPTCTEEGYTINVCWDCGASFIPDESRVPPKGHIYAEEITTAPTCTQPGVKTFTCEYGCGKSYTEDIDPTGHDMADGVVTDPTCTTDGYTTHKCKNCDYSYTDGKVATTGHTFGDWTVTTPAKCEEAGEKERICEKCDFVAKEAIPATGHTHTAKVVAPTCTEKGYTEYICECGNNYKDNYVDATGHNNTKTVDENVDNPTCTGNGSKDVVVYCTNKNNNVECGHEISRTQEVIPATGHTEGELIQAKQPTCTIDGYRAYFKCSVCGKNREEPTVIPAEGHRYDVGKVTTPAGCETEGVLTFTCTNANCDNGEWNGLKGSYTESIQATGHTPGEKHEENRTEPSCTVDGSYNMVVRCEKCNTILDSEYNTIQAPGHTYNNGEVTTEPGCETEGVMTFTCTVNDCGPNVDGYTKTEHIAATGHKPGEAHEEDRVEPKCTEEGSYNWVVRCTVESCKKVITTEQKTIPMLNHDMIQDKAVDATCTTPGLTAGEHCSRCDDATIEQKEISILGHDIVIDEAVAATCTTTGLTEGKHCSRCDDMTVEQQPTPVLGHNMVVISAKAATCTEKGYTASRICDRDNCGYVEIAAKELPATGHNNTKTVDENVDNPTCTNNGSKEVVVYCANKNNNVECGHEISRTQEVIPATGHRDGFSRNENTILPKCEEEGSHDVVTYCSICGDVAKSVHVIDPATGHTEVEIPAVPVSCKAPGYEAGVRCSVCEKVLVEPKEIPVLPHTPEVIPAVDPTCITVGKTEGEKCSVCETVTIEPKDIPVIDHNWGSGRITTDPTCTEVGVRTFTCSMCREEKTEDEPVLGHDLETIPKQKPTYTVDGWEEYERCLREECGHTTYKSIPALGEPTIETFDEFIENLIILEEIADTYIKKVSPGKDPAMLVIKYIRTGVDRYNSGSWNIMAGYEDADFAKYVSKYEADYNLPLEDGEELMKVSGLKNLETFKLPSGDLADVGHIFGLMDISYTNKNSIGHADVSGWAGDTVDLLSAADQYKVSATDIEGMVKEINEKMFLKFDEDFIRDFGEEPIEGTFSYTDIRGDLDGYYIMQKLLSKDYSNGRLTEIISGYMTSGLTDEKRAEYFLKNRLGGVTLRSDVRDAVFNAYSANDVVSTLEGTREFTYDSSKIMSLRKASCYVFADYLCRLAGDYVEDNNNEFLTVFDTKVSTLAPGVSQKIFNATTADDKTMVYYTATADITRGDVSVYANYNNNDPTQGWAMQRVLEQSLAAQRNYSDPTHPKYTKDFNIVAAINGDGYNMYNGGPSGLLVMEGVEYNPSNGSEFFAILKDGTAVIGSNADYQQLKAAGKVKEAMGAFGGTGLIRDGKPIANTSDYWSGRSSRTAIGITKSGKVVFMVVDGRQEGLSCGATIGEVAQIMLDAGCYNAINLDGGGSTTYVAKPEGETDLKVISNPSDGAPRSVSSSLFIASTAPSSNEFDHAVVNSDYNYLTINSSVKLTANAVSATGTPLDMPEGIVWTVADEALGTITQDGVFTAKENGKVTINLMLDDKVIGSKDIFVVVPDNIYFKNATLNAIYEEAITLPVGAVYEGKEVVINENDAVLSVENPEVGTINGFAFTGNEESQVRVVKIIGALTADETITATMTLNMFSKDEASFDFDNATGGGRQFAWDREVSNATTSDGSVYYVVDPEVPMETSYTLALDMSEIPIPKQLESLTYMLPGADLENASAWSFLLQLAERVSVLTNVTPTFTFDKNFDVDYSNVTVSNLYFMLDEENGVTFDKETNTLKLRLNWVDQDQPIPPETANPLCIVSGIKLTPKKDANWSANKQMKVVNFGDISYDIYLRANALYSFAQKPENQEQFGLYPFENTEVLVGGTTEKGGHFMDVYTSFTDTYTMVNALKDGWVMENGGWAYYENAEKYTGYRVVDGFYYDFGEDGINIGQNPYTGRMTIESKEYYAINGKLFYGWLVVDEKNVSYYNPKTGIKEKLTWEEKPSTCIIDGYCDYTSESGATKHVAYDDAGGHEWDVMADGRRKCKVCGYIRVDLTVDKVILDYTTTTYTGGTRRPGTKVYDYDGNLLKKPTDTKYFDYSTEHINNVEVGTAYAVLTAQKYGKYGNLNDWFGNAAGVVKVPYRILPDVPATIKIVDKDGKATITWEAAKAPGVTYVIYKIEADGTRTEVGTTTELSYTLDEEYTSGRFRLGTRKVVNGEVYESMTLSQDRMVAPVVSINNDTVTGKPELRWIPMLGNPTFYVYRSTSENGNFEKVNYKTQGVTYTHASAGYNTTYYYKVKAVYADGTESVFSNVVSGTRLCVAPAVTISVSDFGKPVLEWGKVEGAKQYIVYRAETADGTFTELTTITGRTFIDKTAPAGSTYFYKVQPVSTSGTKGYESRVVYVTAQDVLVVETGNSATSGKPTLKWNVLESEVEEYYVFRAYDRDEEYEKVATVKGTAYIHSGAEAGEVYFYYVEAKLKNGGTVKSEIVSGECMPRFVIETGINDENGRPTLKWDDYDNNVKEYRVYRSALKDGMYARVFTTTGNTYTHVSCIPGNTYYYYVVAVMRDGRLAQSDTVSNTAEIRFNIETGNNVDGKPTLRWEQIKGADSYNVYRYSSVNGKPSDKALGKPFKTKGSTYTNTGAKAPNTYFYQLEVTMKSGKVFISDYVEAKCIVPANIKFDIEKGNNEDGKPTLKWAAIPGAEEYYVYRSEKEDGTYKKALTTKGTTYTNTSAKVGKTYYYQLKVLLVDGRTVESDVISNVCISKRERGKLNANAFEILDVA